MDFVVAAVVPVADNRIINIKRTLRLLRKTDVEQIVLVLDGWESTAVELMDGETDDRVRCLSIPKFGGGGYPRNVGVDHLDPGTTHVWFVDSDAIWDPTADPVTAFRDAYQGCDRIMVGQCLWGAPGEDQFWGRCERDEFRMQFDHYTSQDVFFYDAGAALACITVNLVWPVHMFNKVGGFRTDLIRTEDGELGLRAAEHGIGVSFVKDSQVFHVWHERNLPFILERNAIEVPLLDEMHPWVKGRIDPENGDRLEGATCGKPPQRVKVIDLV